MFDLLIAAMDPGVPAAGPFDPSTLLPTVSALGSLGFAVWYAYYTTTVMIPKLLEAHRTERQELQMRFDARLQQLLAELKEQRQEFSQVRAAERSAHVPGPH